jgi:phage baseplate assembly protein W
MTDFIGKGLSFPPKITVHGGLSWSNGPARVQDAIWLILSTSQGERLMRPDFGAGVADYLMQPNSPLIRTQLAENIKAALTKWEPRIDLEAVRVEPVEDVASQVQVSIEYRLRETNELFNMVYPLFLEEGTA